MPGIKAGNITNGVSRGCDLVPAGTPVGTPNLWFDPCAFTIPGDGFLGHAGRNIVRGPGLTNVDFSMGKDTALSMLGESGKLEFRAEFFNVFNHVNLTGMSTDINSGSFGLATGAFPARDIQFGIRIEF